MSTTTPPSAAAPWSPAPDGVAARAIDAVKTYGVGDTQVFALAGVTVDFAAGQFTAIMGPSGSGKSTLMHCLAGLDELTSGSVWIEGTDLTKLKEKDLTKLRRDRVGFIFQSFNLIPTLSAEENIVLPMSLAGAQPDQAWVDRIAAGGTRGPFANPDCTPGYYNNEGRPEDLKARMGGGDPEGPLAYFHRMAAWRTSGDFAGLTFS